MTVFTLSAYCVELSKCFFMEINYERIVISLDSIELPHIFFIYHPVG
jgi:hypothetical protein